MKILLMLLVGLSSFLFVGCSDMPPEPEIFICSPILRLKADSEIDLVNSYAFCVSDKEPENVKKHKRISLVNYLLSKPVMTTGKEYTNKIEWGNDVKKWGEDHCKLANP